MTSFNDRAASMDLDITKAYKGLYTYEDQFSEVVYRNLQTESEDSVCQTEVPPTTHPTDNIIIPRIAVFTKPVNTNNPDINFEDEKQIDVILKDNPLDIKEVSNIELDEFKINKLHKGYFTVHFYEDNNYDVFLRYFDII